MLLRTRNVLAEMAIEQGWKAKLAPAQLPSESPWVRLTKGDISLDAWCRDGTIWIARENLEAFTAPNGNELYDISHGPELWANLHEPESILAIQEYLRDICSTPK